MPPGRRVNKISLAASGDMHAQNACQQAVESNATNSFGSSEKRQSGRGTDVQHAFFLAAASGETDVPHASAPPSVEQSHSEMQPPSQRRAVADAAAMDLSTDAQQPACEVPAASCAGAVDPGPSGALPATGGSAVPAVQPMVVVESSAPDAGTLNAVAAEPESAPNDPDLAKASDVPDGVCSFLPWLCAHDYSRVVVLLCAQGHLQEFCAVAPFQAQTANP
jgi:hypothetical protein